MKVELTEAEYLVITRLVSDEMDDERDSPERAKMLARLLLKLHKALMDAR